MRQVIEPYRERQITVQMVTGFGGIHPQDLVGIIQDVTDQGMVLRMSGRAGAWTTFISWIDLWAGHVRISESPACDDLDAARQWLTAHYSDRVIDLAQIRSAYGLEAIV